MLAYFFLIIAVATRLAPHPWHLTLIGASLLFFGAKRSPKEWIAPLVVLGALDVYLTRVWYGLPVTPDQLLSVLWYAFALFIGYLLVRKVTAIRVISASLISAISFFVVSNFAVWLFGTMYDKTFAGLVQCYVMAVPFFRGTMVSDLVFTPVLFSIPFALTLLQKQSIGANRRIGTP
jgi:hypothetical protein